MKEDFNYQTEQFADIRILRYQVPEFDDLELDQKILIYYLSQAALCGRDILWDQNNRWNLRIRKVLETIYLTYAGDRKNSRFNDFMVYLKRVWFSNGIHHHYSTEKLVPDFDLSYFKHLIDLSDWSDYPENLLFPEIIAAIREILFNPEAESKRVCLDQDKDLLVSSASNYYQDVTQKEAEGFYQAKQIEDNNTPPSWGLNSRLVKEDGILSEKVAKEGGLYTQAIEKIVFWLEKAVPYAENETQQQVIEKLISYYRTGDLKTFDEYSILWAKDTESHIDFVNGFIEVYGDPLGIKASWESLVNFKDEEASIRTSIISKHAQWFEDHSPVSPAFKKKEVKGVSAKVINAAMLGGDCHPATPIGINLPNADWIRKVHGSKSVTLENITYAYYMSSLSSGQLEEFSASGEEIKRAHDYGYLSSNMHTDLHECLGHGSGQLLPGVSPDALKNYGSTLEETRADLFALYFIADPKMQELGLIPCEEAAWAEFDAYIRNALLVQLARIEPGRNLEESHMRNRQLIAAWVYESGKEDNVIERLTHNDKTYFKINDNHKLRELFGKLLAVIQRIKSEGDYAAGRELVEKYAVKIDPKLHNEVLGRFKKLNLAPYAGFINPEYHPVYLKQELVNVEITYPDDFTKQMLEYSKHYGFLPLINE
ncbi:MAG: dihydrofolate reductase [Bacteroidota bacterium]|nr:dihydrofolate reductase [Bacteroidota bacterium]